jgi:Ca-activated chloride channel family protein
MIFAHPKMLGLTAATLPLLGLFFWWSWRKRRFLISQFVQSRLLAHLTVGLSKGIQKTRMVLLAFSVGLILIALAGPRWGYAWEEARQRGLDIVVAVDTSRSMLAEDIAPNRLQRAKLAALDLMHLAKRDRLGLVAFAGTAFLQCPLTLDDEAFRQSVDELEVGIIPQGGTALAEAIQTAQSAFRQNESENHRVLVLFTDGEDHDSGALEAATKAAEAGLCIFTVGVGTPNGELLRQKNAQGNLDYIKDADGNVVKSHLNESLLTGIAKAANGFYLPLNGANAIDLLYERGLAPLPTTEISSKLIRQYHERFQWPLAFAIILLVIEVFLPDRKRVARSQTIVNAGNPELRRLVALLLLGAFSLKSWASPSSALQEYRSGRFKEAHREYLRLLEKRPDDPRLQFNAGDAAYQAREYQEAAKHFSAAVAAPDPHLQEHAYYNLGNSFCQLGDAETALEKKGQAWEQSLHQFETALRLDPKDSDARYNLDVVRRKLEELKKQQQEQQQKKQQNQDKDDSKEQKQQEKKNQDQQKKDQQNQQQKQSGNKDSQSKTNRQEQPKPSTSDPENKKGHENAKDQQDQSNQQKKPSSDNSETAHAKNDSRDRSPTNATASSSSAVFGQMTPQQAQQLLDSQKDNEKAMIFIPPDNLNQVKPVFKDW